MHTPAGTSTVTAPSAVGVTLNVYVVPDPVKLLMVPLPTVTSEDSKSVTDSSNVMVIGMDEEFVGDDSVEVMVAVGPVPS
jgi:hypothetical protein